MPTVIVCPKCHSLLAVPTAVVNQSDEPVPPEVDCGTFAGGVEKRPPRPWPTPRGRVHSVSAHTVCLDVVDDAKRFDTGHQIVWAPAGMGSAKIRGGLARIVAVDDGAGTIRVDGEPLGMCSGDFLFFKEDFKP